MKQRSVPLAIVLTIITCGIYGLYWLVMLNDEINTVAGRQGTTGGMVLLFSIITCGIYLFYWMYIMGDTLDNIREQRGEARSGMAIVYLLLSVFGLGIVSYALIQNELNRYLPNA